jgi:hypothetical protein
VLLDLLVLLELQVQLVLALPELQALMVQLDLLDLLGLQVQLVLKVPLE